MMADDRSEETVAGSGAEVTPAQAAIIAQTVEAVMRAYASRREPSSGGPRDDASGGTDGSRAPETADGGHGKCGLPLYDSIAMEGCNTWGRGHRRVRSVDDPREWEACKLALWPLLACACGDGVEGGQSPFHCLAPLFCSSSQWQYCAECWRGHVAQLSVGSQCLWRKERRSEGVWPQLSDGESVPYGARSIEVRACGPS